MGLEIIGNLQLQADRTEARGKLLIQKGSWTQLHAFELPPPAAGGAFLAPYAAAAADRDSPQPQKT